MEQVLTTGQVARELDVSDRTAATLADSGFIPVKFRSHRGDRFFDPADVQVAKQTLEEQREARRRLGLPRRGRPRKKDLERRRQQALQTDDTPTNGEQMKEACSA